MSGQTAEEQWVHWWCNPWQWAHPGWHSNFAQAHGVAVSDCHGLMASRHGVFLRSLGIDASQPPMAGEAVLSWLRLTPGQREQALALAQAICFTRYEHDGPDGQWCWALAKALRPGVWLQPELDDARVLLGAWLGAQYWSRLRLAWAPDELPDGLCDSPPNKLQTLWQAIVWRVTAA